MANHSFQQSLSVIPRKLNYLSKRSRQKLDHRIEDTIRSLKYIPGRQEFVNQREVRVLGLRRSGNHAIINWIGQQAGGNSIFMNHVRPLENPYRDQYDSQRILGRVPRVSDWNFRDIDWWQREKEGAFSQKECLIYSYEDQEIEKISKPSFEKKRELYLGKSKNKFDVIIMRDPFNLFASRLKSKPRKDKQSFGMTEVYSRQYSLAELWISYAKECLGETSYLKGNKIFINYNMWFLDIDYRKHIAQKLDIEFSDAGFRRISVAGRGSSFDGEKYAENTDKMDVTNRWRHYMKNPLYAELINTKYLLDYSIALFGHIPGTEIFFPQSSFARM